MHAELILYLLSRPPQPPEPPETPESKKDKKGKTIWKLSKDEEKLLISLIDDIIGSVDDFKDGVLRDLLQINKIMKNLEIALKYV